MARRRGRSTSRWAGALCVVACVLGCGGGVALVGGELREGDASVEDAATDDLGRDASEDTLAADSGDATDAGDVADAGDATDAADASDAADAEDATDASDAADVEDADDVPMLPDLGMLEDRQVVDVPEGDAVVVPDDVGPADAADLDSGATTRPDTGRFDAGTDAEMDAGTDAEMDAETDAETDAGIDTGGGSLRDQGAGCSDLRFTYCGPAAGCVDTAIDPSHCGACDRVCAIGTACIAGACSGPMMMTCTNTLAVCSDAGTVDLSCNVEHCGACDRPCGAGQICLLGVCASL